MLQNFECPCCKSQVWQKVHSLPKFIFGVSAAIYVCKTCSLGITYPRPVTDESYYELNENYAERFTRNRNLYKEFARELLLNIQATEKLTLLDIGCGSGCLVEAATELGFDATGVDANEEVVSWCQRNGINVIKGYVNEYGLGINDKYDVVVLSAVLEHVIDPAWLLEIAEHHLNHGGKILVSQADFSGLLPKFAPWFWYGWQPREHYWHFNIRSLEYLVDNLGLEIASFKQKSLHHPWYLGLSIKDLIGRNFATVLARIGETVKMKDSFDAVLIRKGGK